MNRKNSNGNFDQRWSWPQKTWFQQRLELVRARERAQNRKPLAIAKSSQPVTDNGTEPSQPEKPLG